MQESCGIIGLIRRVMAVHCSFPTSEREAVRAAMTKWNSVTDANGRSIVSMYLTNNASVDNIVNYSLYIDAVATTQPYTIGNEIQSV